MYANYIFTVYFVVEMVIKLAGLGFKHYFASGMNCFDGEGPSTRGGEGVKHY